MFTKLLQLQPLVTDGINPNCTLTIEQGSSLGNMGTIMWIVTLADGTIHTNNDIVSQPVSFKYGKMISGIPDIDRGVLFYTSSVNSRFEFEITDSSNVIVYNQSGIIAVGPKDLTRNSKVVYEVYQSGSGGNGGAS